MKSTNKFYIAVLIVTVLCNACAFQSNKQEKYLIEPGGGDYTPKIFEILKNTIEFPIYIEFKPGEYNFYPETAYEKYLKVSNNDNGLRKIIFAIENKQHVHINGNGATLKFHGSVIPFLVENSDNVSIENLNIEYDSPFDFEGIVVNNNEKDKTFDLKVHSENSFRIKDDILYFKGYDWEMGLGENIVYNSKTKSPEYFTAKYEHDWHGHFLKAKALDSSVVRFSNIHSAKVPPVGSIYVDKGPHGSNRNYPGFRINKSKNVALRNINVYHSGAMALIAEKTENVSLYKFNVLLKQGSSRMISANADATHFINCKGEIKFDSCRFENMLDDATNVHGTYMLCDKMIDSVTVALKFGHFQQQGFDFAEKGDTLRFIDRANILQVFNGIVKKVEMVNENYYLVSLQKAMKNCSVKQNRARSLLISTSKSVLIENSYFASMMAGIRICGDANYWFESGPVSSVIIRGNTFEDLGVGGHNPQAILQIDPIIHKIHRKDGYYHKNIVFENNTVKTFDPLIIYALSVDGLIIRNNTIIQTNTFPQIFSELSQFDIQNCINVKIEGNVYKGDNEATISAIECNNIAIKPLQKGFAKETVKNPNKYFYQN